MRKYAILLYLIIYIILHFYKSIYFNISVPQSKSFCGFLKETKRNNTKEALMQLALFALSNH